MAYADGNSVTLTPDYAFSLEGAESNGAHYPRTMAVAFKIGASETSSFTLIGAGDAATTLRYATLVAVWNGSQYNLRLEARGGAPGADTELSTFAISRGDWHIAVVKFTDTENWRLSVDSETPDVFDLSADPAADGGSVFDDYWLGHRSGVLGNGTFAACTLAYGAWWTSALADATMDAIAAGTTSPNDASPAKLLYFEGTTPIEGETSATVTTLDNGTTGAIATEGTDPTGWPPGSGLAHKQGKQNLGKGFGPQVSQTLGGELQ